MPEHDQALRIHLRPPRFREAGCIPGDLHPPGRCTPSLHSLDWHKPAASCWPMRRGDLFQIYLPVFPVFDTALRGLVCRPGCPPKPTHPETGDEVPAPFEVMGNSSRPQQQSRVRKEGLLLLICCCYHAPAMPIFIAYSYNSTNSSINSVQSTIHQLAVSNVTYGRANQVYIAQ